MFDADRPIHTSQQDRLGRTVFAKYLARCMLDQTIPDSIVVGMMGGLGSGKTSLIYLTLEELNYASGNMFDDERPVILNFNPWRYVGQQSLAYHFFQRLSFAIEQFSYWNQRERIVELLKICSGFFTTQPMPPKKSLLSRLKKTSDVEQDFTQVKTELNTLLSQQKHKLIIIMDNIGRLDNAGIKQVFQIVKSLGNFANTIFLLAFDKVRILNAIQDFQGNDPGRYLEKIIQLPFDIPEIPAQALEGILFERLKKIIAIAVEDTWNADYWADLYYSCLKKFFISLRDVVRYVNTLGFSFIHVKEVVNPVDFFALTAIEMFEPNVYLGIRDNKDLFTDLLDAVYQVDPARLGKDKIRCDEILSRAERMSSVDLQLLLMQMFPRLRHVYQPTVLFYHSESIARKNLRICSPDVFDVYFRLSLSLGCMPESEVNAILTLAADEQAFMEALQRLNQEDRAAQFLTLLDGAENQKIATPYVANVVRALIETLDLLPAGESGVLSFDTQTRAHRIIHQLLRRFDTTEQRYQILRDAIQKAVKSIYSIIHELDEQSREHRETEDTFVPLAHRDLTPKQLDELKKLAVEKIKFWAEHDRLAEHPKLIDILYAWKDWGSDLECRAFVEQMVQTDRGIIAFLEAALKDPIDEVIANLEKNPDWENDISTIADFIAPEKIEPHAKLLFEDLYFEKLREREQLALMIFLDLIKADTLKIIPKTTV